LNKISISRQIHQHFASSFFRKRHDETLLGLKSLIGVKIKPDETLLRLKLSRTRNMVKIELDETLLGLKIYPDESQTGPYYG